MAKWKLYFIAALLGLSVLVDFKYFFLSALSDGVILAVALFLFHIWSGPDKKQKQ